MLLNADFMRKHGSGHYVINPGIIFKSAYTRRCAALDAYQKLLASDAASQDELRISDVQMRISRLKRQEMYLKSRFAERTFYCHK